MSKNKFCCTSPWIGFTDSNDGQNWFEDFKFTKSFAIDANGEYRHKSSSGWSKLGSNESFSYKQNDKDYKNQIKFLIDTSRKSIKYTVNGKEWNGDFDLTKPTFAFFFDGDVKIVIEKCVLS